MRRLDDYKERAEKAQRTYEQVKVEARRNLELIKNGCKFGYIDNEYGEYFPLQLMRIADEENCLIVVFEPGKLLAEEELTDTLDLWIVPPMKEGYNDNQNS